MKIEVDGSGNEVSRVSSTAVLCAHVRQFSDIPNAAEIASALKSEEIFEQYTAGEGEIENLQFFAVLCEWRYKAISSHIRDAGVDQVLELASGFTFRGLELLQSIPELVYIDTDLPGIVTEKLNLIARVSALQEFSDRLVYRAANALSEADLEEAIRGLSLTKPLAIVNEGLMNYLTMEDKELLARNIRALLLRFGGVWITPDFRVKSDFRAGGLVRSNRDLIQETTDTPFSSNYFHDEGDVQAFLRKLGLKGSCLALDLERSHLTVHQSLNISNKFLAGIYPYLKMWKITT